MTSWRLLLKTGPLLATAQRVTAGRAVFMVKQRPFTSNTSKENKWFEVERREEFSVDTKQLQSLIDKNNVLVIDVREPDEVAAGAYPAKRCVNIPIGLFIRSMTSYTDSEFREKYGIDKPQKTDSDIVFACKVGLRSTFALQLAQSWGYSNTKHYRDGWMVWQKQASSK